MANQRLAVLSTVLLSALAFGVGGCGKKGDPLPPIRPIPATAQDFEVIQRGDRLLLSAPYPSTTVAGTPLSEVAGASVWSLVRIVPAGTRQPPPIDERQFGASARPVRTLEGPDLDASVRGSRIALSLPLSELTGDGDTETEGLPIATVAVKTRGPTGHESAFSNLVTLPVREAPVPPTMLELEGEHRGVRLRWNYPEPEASAPEDEPEPPHPDPAPDQAPVQEPDQEPDETPDATPDAGGTEEQASGASDAGDSDEDDGEGEDPAEQIDEGDEEDRNGGIRGFNVYRRTANERLYGEPLRKLPRRARTFVDESAVFGKRYVYAVTAVAERRPVQIESAIAEEVEIAYRDRFPPAVPAGVVALFQGGRGDEEAPRVRVVWRPVEASDLAGYRVYRQGPESEELRPLNDEPIARTELVDDEVTPGATYTYRVRAVDREGNESEPSEPAGATIR